MPTRPSDAVHAISVAINVYPRRSTYAIDAYIDQHIYGIHGAFGHMDVHHPNVQKAPPCIQRSVRDANGDKCLQFLPNKAQQFGGPAFKMFLGPFHWMCFVCLTHLFRRKKTPCLVQVVVRNALPRQLVFGQPGCEAIGPSGTGADGSPGALQVARRP